MIGKCMLGVVPSYLRVKCIRTKDFHSYSTQNDDSNMCVPRVSCNAVRNVFCYEEAVLLKILNNTFKN